MWEKVYKILILIEMERFEEAKDQMSKLEISDNAEPLIIKIRNAVLMSNFALAQRYIDEVRYQSESEYLVLMYNNHCKNFDDLIRFKEVVK